jgi:hypothetical protein
LGPLGFHQYLFRHRRSLGCRLNAAWLSATAPALAEHARSAVHAGAYRRQSQPGDHLRNLVFGGHAKALCNKVSDRRLEAFVSGQHGGEHTGMLERDYLDVLGFAP